MQNADYIGLMWSELESQVSEYLRLRQQFDSVRLERRNLRESLDLFCQLLDKQKSNAESAQSL